MSKKPELIINKEDNKLWTAVLEFLKWASLHVGFRILFVVVGIGIAFVANFAFTGDNWDEFWDGSDEEEIVEISEYVEADYTDDYCNNLQNQEYVYLSGYMKPYDIYLDLPFNGEILKTAGFKLYESQTGFTSISVSISDGYNANEMNVDEKPRRQSDIIVYDYNGEVIDPTTRVKLYGTMKYTQNDDGSKRCSIDSIKRLEQAEF